MRPAWNRLAGPFANPLFNHEWFLSCAENLYREHDLRVVVVESQDGIAAIAPLAVVKRNGIEWLEILGASTHYEPGGFLYDSENSLHQLVTAVLGLRRPVHLQRIPYGSPLVPVLRKMAKYRGIVLERCTSGSRAIHINSDWEEYYRSLSSRTRNNLRRARGRAEATGKVSIAIFCPEPHEIERHLTDAFRIEASGWKGRRGSALTSNTRLGDFIRSYAGRASKERLLRLCFLSVGEEAVAMQIGVEFADRFWLLKIGYDESWSRCSPGMLLTMEIVRYAFSKGLRSYEFLGVDAPWKREWIGERREFASVGIYPFTPNGFFSFGLDAGNYLVRRIFKADSDTADQLRAC